MSGVVVLRATDSVSVGDVLTAVATVAAVLVGVSFERWLSRRNDRRRAIEAATLELSLLVSTVMTPLWDEWDGPREVRAAWLHGRAPATGRVTLPDAWVSRG